MSEVVTLTQVEQLVAQLPITEQLKLISHISEQLTTSSLVQQAKAEDEEQWRREYRERIEAFLAMSEEMAAEPIGAVDSAEDIRQIREERTSKL